MAGDNFQEQRMKELKRELESWREVILPINSFLIWEKNWYPGILVAVNTFIWLLFWYWDPSVLFTIGFVGLLAAIADVLVPYITANFRHPDSWTGAKERQFEEICRSLATCEFKFRQFWTLVVETRASQPSLYYWVTIPSLLVLAWIGYAVNNLLLTYLIVTIVMLLPGMKHHRLSQNSVSEVVNALSGVVKTAKEKIKGKDKEN